MTQPICTDRNCPLSWAEHDAHDDRPARIPTDALCTDRNCPNAFAEHEAHGTYAGGER